MNQPITRRSALQKLAAGAATLAAGARFARAAESSAKGRFVEKQPTGAEIFQVTTEEFDQANIYGEVPYCSRDSRYLVYARRNPALKTNQTEFMRVELGTWKQQRLDTAVSMSGSAISPDGRFYYLKQADDGATQLVRADLETGEVTALHRFPPGLPIRSLGTVSSDGRFYAVGTMSEPGWRMFDLSLIDLQTGTHRILDRDPFIFNAHPQFEPGAGRQLMMQHNRGGKYSADGKRERMVGPEGATLYLLSVPEGRRTELAVGTPHTTPCTGHEAWIGTTGEMLLSVRAKDRFSAELGNLLTVRGGQPARVIARGYDFNHCGASRCGRIFWGDDWKPPYRIVVGSVQTGRSAVVCESKTNATSSQNSHAHPYVTPDLKWAIFNSTRTGSPHIHAARIPDELIAEVLA